MDDFAMEGEVLREALIKRWNKSAFGRKQYLLG
jgi:hypothetical protein